MEQAGIVDVLQPGSSTPAVFLDIRSKVKSGGEQGLLGLAFHPNCATNGRFFVFYTYIGNATIPAGTLVIAEFKVSSIDANVADPTETVVLRIPHPTNTNHNGGMLAFGPDGYLYIGVGDGGSANDPPNNAQNEDVLLGKILRIDRQRCVRKRQRRGELFGRAVHRQASQSEWHDDDWRADVFNQTVTLERRHWMGRRPRSTPGLHRVVPEAAVHAQDRRLPTKAV